MTEMTGSFLSSGGKSSRNRRDRLATRIMSALLFCIARSADCSPIRSSVVPEQPMSHVYLLHIHVVGLGIGQQEVLLTLEHIHCKDIFRTVYLGNRGLPLSENESVFDLVHKRFRFLFFSMRNSGNIISHNAPLKHFRVLAYLPQSW